MALAVTLLSVSDGSPRTTPGMLAGEPPPTAVGVLAAVAGVGAATLAIYPLSHLAPYVSLSVVYLPAVLFVSAIWGLWLGLFTSLLSAAAFNFFHLPPVGRFTIADPRNWVALAAFTTVAVVASWMAGVARTRAIEAERRRVEANLAAALARELLAGADTQRALAAAAHQLSAGLGLSSASIELGLATGDERRACAVPAGRLGTDCDAAGAARAPCSRPPGASSIRSCRPSRRSSRSRCDVTRSRPRPSRRRRCDAVMTSRRLCYVPCPTTCVRR